MTVRFLSCAWFTIHKVSSSESSFTMMISKFLYSCKERCDKRFEMVSSSLRTGTTTEIIRSFGGNSASGTFIALFQPASIMIRKRKYTTKIPVRTTIDVISIIYKRCLSCDRGKSHQRKDHSGARSGHKHNGVWHNLHQRFGLKFTSIWRDPP